MVDVSHDFLRPVMHRQAILVDGTLGSGRDSKFLLKRAKKVVAYEVQAQAIEKAKKCFSPNELDRLEIRHESHETIKDLDESIDGAIFNFGWWPDGDTNITTIPETSLKAVQAAFDHLKPKGRMALVFYPHMAGKAEAELIESWLKTLDHRAVPTEKVTILNADNAPFALLVEKRR